MNISWAKELSVAVTVCDREGIILEMNEKALKTFEADGGRSLIGTNVLNCHPEPSRTKLADMMANQTTNAYTVEKKGIKKMIYQTPWYENGEYAGFVEFSMVIPEDMPHFIRKSQ